MKSLLLLAAIMSGNVFAGALKAPRINILYNNGESTYSTAWSSGRSVIKDNVLSTRCGLEIAENTKRVAESASVKAAAKEILGRRFLNGSDVTLQIYIQSASETMARCYYGFAMKALVDTTQGEKSAAIHTYTVLEGIIPNITEMGVTKALINLKKEVEIVESIEDTLDGFSSLEAAEPFDLDSILNT